jgi:hypothetical protein
MVPSKAIAANASLYSYETKYLPSASHKYFVYLKHILGSKCFFNHMAQYANGHILLFFELTLLYAFSSNES